MPSLVTNNRHLPHKIDTFRQFIKYSEHGIPRRSTTGSVLDVPGFSEVLPLFNHMLLLIVILIVMGVVGASSQLLKTKYNHVYNSHSLYWAFDYIIFVLSFFICFLIVGVIISRLYETVLNGTITTATVFVVINGTILYFVIDDFSSNNDTNKESWSHYQLLNLYCDKIFSCEYFKFGYFYLYCVIPCGLPLIQVSYTNISVAIQCYFISKRIKIKSNCNSNSNSLNINKHKYINSKKYKNVDTAVALLDLDSSDDDSNNNININININRDFDDNDDEDEDDSQIMDKLRLYELQGVVRATRWGLIVWILWSSYGIFFYFYSNIQPQYFSNHWLELYWLLVVITDSVKWVSKLMSIKMDQIRIEIQYWRQLKKQASSPTREKLNKIRNTMNFTNDISTIINDPHRFKLSKPLFAMEWQVELMLSLAYWIFYREFAVYYLKDLSTKELIQTGVIHFATQLLHTIRACPQYFTVTNYWQNYLKNNLNKKSLYYKIICWIYDDSTFEEWSTRLGADFCIRIIVAIATTVWFIFYLTLFIKHISVISYDQEMKVIKFTMISFATDIITFALFMFVQFKSKPDRYAAYFIQNWKRHKNLFTISWIGVMGFFLYNWTFINRDANF